MLRVSYIYEWLNIKNMRLVSFFFILFLITSCKKENLPYTFIGKVTDKLNNSVVNASVELGAYFNSSNAITPGGFSKLTTTQTNDVGEFKVLFNQSDGIKYYLVKIFAQNYFPFYQEYINVNNFHDGILQYNASIFKLATIKIYFKNATPVSSSDEFHVFQENELFGGGFDTFIERQFTGGTFNELEHTYIGGSIQGYERTKTKGDTYTVINWTSKKNGVIKVKKDSVFIAGGTEGSYTINY